MGTLPKNLIRRLSRAGSLGRRGLEPTAHASRVRAKLALGMAQRGNTEGKERGLLYRSTWVSECAPVSRHATPRHASPRLAHGHDPARRGE
jgi:hypothetical protein